jgi:hypothetical protein
MNTQDYIQRQQNRRNKTVGMVVVAMFAMLAIAVFFFWIIREPASASIPEPGTITVPPDQYPETAAHAVTMAGYDLSNEDKPFILLADPADNTIAGKSHDFNPTPLRLPLVTDGRWWFVDYPGKAIGCVYGALIIREFSQDNEKAPDQWEQSNLPDLSQNAIEEWGENYCAPAAAANVAWILGEKYPRLAPASVFDLPQNAPLALQANRLVAGVEPPMPNPGSMANLMNTDPGAGTTFPDLVAGFESYLQGSQPGEWTLFDPELLKPKPLIELLKSESARGSGVVLLLHWGNLQIEDEDAGGSTLVVLERNTQPQEPQESTAAPEEDTGLDPVILTEDEGGSGVDEFRMSQQEIIDRLDDVKAGSGDIQLSLIWDNYNDLDLSCVEPNGTVIDFEHRLALSGGNLDVDMNATPQSKRPVENLFWPLGQAQRGTYRVYVNYYRRHTLSKNKVEFSLRVLTGDKDSIVKGSVAPESGRILVHTFKFN